jgi:glucose/arabinose dehydrogenase
MTQLLAKSVATGFARPIFATSPPGDKDRLFVVEQHTGKIRILRLDTGAVVVPPFLQVTGLSTGNEQGLLGLAFAPDYETSGLFYISLTDSSGASVIRRHKVTADSNVAESAGTNILTIPQPFSNHKGGWIAFGPKDKLLYIGIGDGGSEGDPKNTSQNLGLLLGKMLRIDPTRDDFPADPARNYGIPADNPFKSNSAASPEIWAFGLRNPWRCGFDRKTGDLYIGDVGQDNFEEIDFQPANSKGGENYGWSFREGKDAFKPAPVPSPKFVDPIVVYSHDLGEQAVIGGYVYRGSALTALQGTYFFADMTGTFSSFAFDGTTPPVVQSRTGELFPSGVEDVNSFGEDANGELYVCVMSGSIFRIVAATS